MTRARLHQPDATTLPPGPAELAWADDPVDDQLMAWARALDGEALGEFAAALGHRHDEPWARTQNMAMASPPRPRSPEAGGPGAAGVSATATHPPVSAAAVAAYLRALVIETGDDIATVAAGVGVQAQWARGVLTGSVADVDGAHVASMCDALGSTPQELFGPDPSASPMATSPDRDRTWCPSRGRAQLATDPAASRAEGLWPPPEELLPQLPGSDGAALVRLAHALGDHHAELSRRSRSTPSPEGDAFGPQRLAEAPTAERAGAPTFAAGPAAAQLAVFVIDTGDDLNTVARGLGMDPGWVHGVLAGEITSVDADQARRLCRGLDVSPTEVFGPGAASLGAVPVPADRPPPGAGFGEHILAAMRSGLAVEADHRGLGGRQRDDWIERGLDDLTDACVPLPSADRPVVGLVAQYRSAVLGGTPLPPSLFDAGPVPAPGGSDAASPLDTTPVTPELGLGP